MTIRRSQIRPGTASKLVGNDSSGNLADLNYVTHTNSDWNNANDTTNFRFVSQYAIKQYVDSHSSSAVDWQESIIAVADFGTIDATTPKTVGDRYLCDTVNAGQEQYLNNILTWNGSSWDLTPPNLGMMTYDADTTNFWLYDGSTWIEKTFGAEYYGGAGITRSGNEFSLDLTTNGGLQFSGVGSDQTIGVKVNSNYMKLDSNGIGLKDGTPAQIQFLSWDGTSNWDIIHALDVIAECFVSNLSPTESPDGTRTVFNISTDIILQTSIGDSPSTTMVYVNGVRQKYTDHYSISGPHQITFVDAPDTGDLITIDAWGTKYA